MASLRAPRFGDSVFITAGVCMNYSGVTKRIMDFAYCNRQMGGRSGSGKRIALNINGRPFGSNLADAAMEAKCWFLKWKDTATRNPSQQ